MKYENLQKGIKSLFKAEILSIVGAILTIVGLVVTAVGAAAAVTAGMGAMEGMEDSVDLGVGGLVGAGVGAIVMLIGAILAIIAFILSIVGVVNGSKDNQRFKTSLIFLIIGLVFSVISGFTQAANPTASEVCTIIANLTTLVSTIMIIQGIIEVAAELGKDAIVKKGTTTYKLICVFYIILVIVRIITAIMGVTGVALPGTIVAVVLGIIATVISIVNYFIYLSLLAQATKMF